MMKFVLILGMIKKDEWLDFFKNDAFCFALSYARNSKATQEITGVGKKDCLSLPELGGKISLLCGEKKMNQ